jgi:hypothetical protein
MSSRRLRLAVVSETADAIIRFAAQATTRVRHSKTLLSGGIAALFVLAAIPLLLQPDQPSVAANSTLKCYDNAGNVEPCGTRAAAPAPRIRERTAEAHPLASWIGTALYRPQAWQTAEVAQEPGQEANLQANPAPARRAAAPRKHLASPVCRRHLVPCFFSALRKGVTHLASLAASGAQARSGGQRL